MELYSKRQELISIYSDAHKEAYGCRPRGVNFNRFTDEELESSIEWFFEKANADADAEATWREGKVKEFKSFISRYQEEFGAKDEETALRWHLESQENEIHSPQCIDMILYDEGIASTPYGDRIAEKLCGLAFGRKESA